MDPSTCPAVGQLDIVPASGCVPMLVNLDTDPGEAQLRTLICEPETTAPGPMKGQLEPRCHTQEEIQPILTALWQLYNVSNCRGEDGCDLWGASEIGRGGNAAERFPCCDPGCSPKPYCCKCAPGETGPEPPTTEQHIVGCADPSIPHHNSICRDIAGRLLVFSGSMTRCTRSFHSGKRSTSWGGDEGSVRA